MNVRREDSNLDLPCCFTTMLSPVRLSSYMKQWFTVRHPIRITLLHSKSFRTKILLSRGMYLKHIRVPVQLNLSAALLKAKWCIFKYPSVVYCEPIVTNPKSGVTPLHDPCHLNVEVKSGRRGRVLYVLWRIWDVLCIVLRIVQLFITFLPVVVLYPVTIINVSFRRTWYKVLLFAIEFSGPIFIKLGQWASTRRDLFSEEFCSQLSSLQRRTRPHSWFYTEYRLEKAYGRRWREIFPCIENDLRPIGSGCCAQVYKAWMDPQVVPSQGLMSISDESVYSYLVEGLEVTGIGYFLLSHNKHLEENSNFDQNEAAGNTESQARKQLQVMQKAETKDDRLVPVALKVLHPRIDTLLRRDLAILKTGAWFLTFTFPKLRWLSLPECVDDFGHVMSAQVNMTMEAKNLEKFAKNFSQTKAVKFPKPLWPLVHPCVLVETYEEGQPLLKYVTEEEDTKGWKSTLAEIGVDTLLKMVFEDNFTHGDLHPGNMLVQKCESSRAEKKSVIPLFRARKISTDISPCLVILDCGIVTALDDYFRGPFKNMFAAIATGNGKRVAEIFLKYSKHQCEDEEAFKTSISNLVTTTLSNTLSLKEIEVASLMSSFFSTLIDHKVKLNADFSSIILAIMVLEGLGRSLDPTIDILKKAKPYLLKTVKPRKLQHI